MAVLNGRILQMVRIGIVGATGYSGQELVRYLLRHPHVQISYLASRRLEKPVSFSKMFPEWSGKVHLQCRPFKIQDAIRYCDVIFLALPHAVAMSLTPAFVKAGKYVIDLSGDYRLKSASGFAKAYQMRHADPKGLANAVYGLTELYREQIRKTKVVANPGCYSTASILAAAPLVKRRIVEPAGLIIDAKSGVTGAGKSLKEELLFTEMNEELRAYKPNDHQHMPEIDQALRQWGGRSLRCAFVPHLVPMNRGIFATVYLRLTRRVNEKQMQRWYEEFYKGSGFVRVLPAPSLPKTGRVAYTNDCEIAVRAAQGGRLAIVMATIDNLGKGAAGQAVQNMNVMMGFDEEAGLQ
ncbi:MAG: N-acetyl-gamma-glutamyl-phosphate reductase [Candidatus Omnitrophica bacterium]|nr:N-acetyl-gamma-glutamyl-phosphate reductase [Candidatus Omnitrophota bacterium]